MAMTGLGHAVTQDSRGQLCCRASAFSQTLRGTPEVIIISRQSQGRLPLVIAYPPFPGQELPGYGRPKSTLPLKIDSSRPIHERCLL